MLLGNQKGDKEIIILWYDNKIIIKLCLQYVISQHCHAKMYYLKLNSDLCQSYGKRTHQAF